MSSFRSFPFPVRRSALLFVRPTVLFACLLGLGAALAPAEVRAQSPAAAVAKGAAATGPVDLNTADEATLESLPGVGPALAKQIVATRPFASVEDLTKVKGIGPAKLAALRNQVTVSGAKPAPTAAMPTLPPAATKPAMPPMPKPALPAAPAAVPAPPVAPSAPTKPALAVPSAAAASKAAKLPAGKVNINTAAMEELEALPGIGPVKAKAIVAGRPYEKPEDVMKVSGIKQGVYGKIKDFITVQ